MVNFTFDIEIHVWECFVEDQIQRYVGESVHTLTEIDPDMLSFFEIRDLYHQVGAPKEHRTYRYLFPKGDLEHDKIIIYTNINVKPLAIEHPNGKGVTNDSIGGDGGVVAEIGGNVDDGRVNEINLESDCDEVVLEEKKDVENDEEEDVENVRVSAGVEEQLTNLNILFLTLQVYLQVFVSTLQIYLQVFVKKCQHCVLKKNS